MNSSPRPRPRRVRRFVGWLILPAFIAALVLYDTTGPRIDDAVVYLGADDGAVVPQALRADVLGSDVPVSWAGATSDRLVGRDQAATAGSVAEYGWNPHEARPVPSDSVPS